VLKGLGVEDFHAAARRALGMALVLEGQHEEGRALLEQARNMLVELREPAEVVETDAAIALALLAGGEAEAAAELADDAAVRATALDAGYLLPWLLRLYGAALSDAGRLEDAEDVLLRAMELAQGQSRIELAFILAERAEVAVRAGDLAEATRLLRDTNAAFDAMGFVGSHRYPRG
jgi:ATP/maltotriose-dependent transcriptional regulator MalT